MNFFSSVELVPGALACRVSRGNPLAIVLSISVRVVDNIISGLEAYKTQKRGKIELRFIAAS